MYTQCPDCDSAFPVTARVLQQAAGRVRCGRCGRPFNALERLSEDPPGSRDGPDDSRSVLDALEALAGPDDIRIEDTGVEWRVIDEDAVDPADADAGEDDADEADRSSVRWYIEDAASAGDDAAVVGTRGDVPRRADGEPEASLVRRRAQQSLQLAARDGEEELRYDDNTPLPDDFGEDAEHPEPPRRRAEDFAEPRSSEFDERQVDLALVDPGEWMELLDELGSGEDEQRPAVDDTGGAQDPDLADTDVRLLEDADDEAEPDAAEAEFPRDIDTQFDLQAVEMGIELTGSRAVAGAGDEAESTLEDDPEPGELELATDGAEGQAIEVALLEDEPGELELATDTDSGAGSQAAGDARQADRVAARERAGDEAQAGVEVHEQRPVSDGPATARAAAAGGGAEREASGHEPSPLTEEELTINRLIDQDLMRFAEQQDTLASTTAGMHRPRAAAPHVETIIMEGEFVRTALEDDEEGDSGVLAKARESDEARDLMDAWLENRPTAQAEEKRPTEPRSLGAIAAICVLGLLLVVQGVHTYRDSLATNGAFERAAAPVYRLLGVPLVPNWDARGWQFQATSGGTDATGDVLSISSRIANESGRALPYPLIYLSLTDRWEEPVGASVLQPAEYLAPGTESTALVPAGEKFSARITVRSLSPDASGFKLNVCYPADAGRLRCAIEDFRK